MIDARVLLIGLGGLGSPAARVLARSGVGSITLIDDDVVTEDNLHRQTLFSEADVGLCKAEVGARVLTHEALAAGSVLRTNVIIDRFVPRNAPDLVASHDLLVEGSDNFATKFMAADAARLGHRPIVQAGAVRWNGWALCTTEASACLRCVFEDIPRDRIETCAQAGVVGPVVGVLGALQAAMALRQVTGEAVGGELWHYEGLSGSLRRQTVRPRRDCPLCRGDIGDLRVERYRAASAA